MFYEKAEKEYFVYAREKALYWKSRNTKLVNKKTKADIKFWWLYLEYNDTKFAFLIWKYFLQKETSREGLWSMHADPVFFWGGKGGIERSCTIAFFILSYHKAYKILLVLSILEN